MEKEIKKIAILIVKNRQSRIRRACFRAFYDRKEIV